VAINVPPIAAIASGSFAPPLVVAQADGSKPKMVVDAV